MCIARLTLPTFHRVDWEKKWEGKICGFCKYILHIAQNEQKPTWPKFTITSRNIRRGFYKTTADTTALPILYKFQIKKTHSNPRAVLNQDALETWAARVPWLGCTTLAAGEVPLSVQSRQSERKVSCKVTRPKCLLRGLFFSTFCSNFPIRLGGAVRTANGLYPFGAFHCFVRFGVPRAQRVRT